MRNLKIDTLKGFLIILVVIGHIPFSYFSLQTITPITIFSSWLYFFHMPLFLAISTLFIKANIKWLGKRFLLILSPYLFWFFWAHKRMLLQNPTEFIGGH
jgi:fucose 4-O-acetylase-like acetyltransferase